jgi:thiamine-monophosphate kinase
MKDEFKLIEKLLAYAPEQTRGDAPLLRVPAGDDACLLRQLKNPVVTTDTQRNGVHFKLSWQTPEEIGKKAVASTLSDLAASYAMPVSLFVNLSIPPSIKDDTIEELYKGMRTSLIYYKCSLGGGNVSVGRDLSLDLFAVGEGRDGMFPVRSAAKDGFGVYSTGPLGLAAAGLDALKRGDASFQRLISAFKNPLARFDAADILAENRVRCVMDISDGLVGDASHIAKASGVTIKLFVPEGQIDPDLSDYCEKNGLIPEHVFLSGGEDYELLFACSLETFDKVKKGLPDSFQVGECLPDSNEYVTGIPSEIASFRHGTCARSDS